MSTNVRGRNGTCLSSELFVHFRGAFPVQRFGGVSVQGPVLVEEGRIAYLQLQVLEVLLQVSGSLRSRRKK